MAISLSDLHSELRSALDAPPAEPQPPFDFRIGWCGSYEDLFTSRIQVRTEPGVLFARALENGRVLLHARGGSAKTSIFRRLMREILGPRCLPVWINLRRWTTPDYTAWKEYHTSTARLNFLLETHASPRVTTVLLDALPANVTRVLFVDGLNEILMDVAEDILNALDSFARLMLGGSVIVGDRMVRRELSDPEAWQLATIMPFSESEIRSYLTRGLGSDEMYDAADEATRALLASPYFLNAAIHDGHAAPTRSAVHAQWFKDHASLTTEELARASEAAFEAYRHNKTRNFRLADFQRVAGESVVHKLLRENVLLVTGDQACFDHHLKHDYLAAYYLAQDPELWIPATFNRVTFWASSFETLVMALELLDTTAAADHFVRRVYDWNQYGAAYAATEARDRGRLRVSKEMETVLLAVLADRQWDLMSATATRVKDGLLMFGTPESTAFVTARSREEVVAIVDRVESHDPLFLSWRALFTRPSGEIISDSELALIEDPSSLVGWTMSNTLKRMKVPEVQQARLRELLYHKSMTIRWRAVHTLGGFPNPANVRVLLGRLDNDLDPWVRYGTIRSLLEIAALGDSRIRVRVFSALRERLAKIVRDEKTIQEFERAIFIDRIRAPKDWLANALGLVQVLRDVEDSGKPRSHWEELAYRLRDTYEVVTEAVT